MNYNDYVSESNYISNYFTTDKSTISTTEGLRYKLDTQAGKPQSYIFQQFKDVAKAVMPSLQVNESATINVVAGPTLCHIRLLMTVVSSRTTLIVLMK